MGIGQLAVTERSVVIVGANGSGKTRLGAMLASHNGSQRIAAQRVMQFNEAINPTSFENALEQHLVHVRNFSQQPTAIQTDFDSLLITLVSQEYQASNQYRLAARATTDRVAPPETLLDVIVRTWNALLPHRKLEVADSKLIAGFEKPGVFSVRHGASHLSDGEKGVLYMIGQVLCFRRDSIIIVDEPEIHLHRSILGKLWDEMEALRPDCLFVYLTHDLEFASSRRNTKKIWLRGYSDYFDWCELPAIDGIPEHIYLEVVGSRHPVLFVEGEIASLDYQLFSLIYPEYKIRPCGSCERVIVAARSFNTQKDLHRMMAAAIVDGDFRSRGEQAEFEAEGIFCLNFAHIENVFLHPEIFRYIAKAFCVDEATAMAKLENLIFSGLERDREGVAQSMAVASLERSFSMFPGKDSPGKAWHDLRELDFGNLARGALNEVNRILKERDYIAALRIYRNKGCLPQAGGALGLRSSDFSDRLMALFRKDHAAVFPILAGILPQIGKAKSYATTPPVL